MNNIIDSFFRFINNFSDELISIDKVKNTIAEKEENEFNQVIKYVNKEINSAAKYTENRFCLIYESENVPFYYFSQLIVELKEAGYHTSIEIIDQPDIPHLSNRRVVYISWDE